LLIAALHAANLATLTSTPMGSESKIRSLLRRPAHEKVFLLLPVGYPGEQATVPHRVAAPTRAVDHLDVDHLRKPLPDVMTFH
jgi:iodotyrosine deiodinase